MSKDRKLVTICVVDIATGVFEAGTWVGARNSPPLEGTQQNPTCFLYSRNQTHFSEVEGFGAWF
jgi:hypothetical protein